MRQSHACVRPGIGLALVLALIVAGAGRTHGGATPEALLAELELRRSAVKQEIARLPELARAEVETVVGRMDEFWVSADVKGRFARFHEEAGAVAGAVHLAEEHNRLGLIWAEYKSLVDATALETIAAGYVRDVSKGVEPLFEKLVQDINGDAGARLEAEFLAAQRRLAEHVDRAISEQFAQVPASFARTPLQKIAPGAVVAVEAGSLPGRPGMRTVLGGGLIAGAAAGRRLLGPALRKVQTRVSRRVAEKVVQKTMGKVGTRLVPVLGWALILWEGVDVATAKTRIESQLRALVLAEYARELQPEAIWSGVGEEGTSLRATLQRDVSEKLARWTEAAVAVADRLLEPAVLFENPSFRAFAEEKIAAGWDLQSLADFATRIHSVFSDLARSAPVEKLAAMIELSPEAEDRVRLRRLADDLGLETVALFEKNGRRLLDASRDLGVDWLIVLVRDRRDWDAIHRQFVARLPADASAAARRGFRAAIEIGLQIPASWTSPVFEELGRETTLAGALAQDGADPVRLGELLLSRPAKEAVRTLLDVDRELASALFLGLPTLELTRFATRNDAEILASAWRGLRAREEGATAAGFAARLRGNAELVDLLKEYGPEVLALHDAYLAGGAGRLQEREFRRALALVERGCPIDIARDRRNLGATEAWFRVPMVPHLYLALYPALKALPWLSMVALGAVALLVLLAVAHPIVSVAVSLRRRRRRRRDAGAHEPPPVRSADDSGRTP